MVQKNNFRRQVCIICLLTLICSAVGTLSIGGAHATPTAITVQQKGTDILSSVLGLNMSRYSLATTAYTTENQEAYLSSVSQENVAYNLTSSKSTVRLVSSFANGNLRTLQLLQNQGPVSLVKPVLNTSANELAQSFLSNYQTYSNNPTYGTLKATLNNLDTSKNITVTCGTTNLEATTIDGYTSFKWTYTAKGILSPDMFVGLGFKNGFFSYFVDNWQYYKIDNTNVSVSENTARLMALCAAKSQLQSMNLNNNTVDRNFNSSNVQWTSLVFESSSGANNPRSSDSSLLYPVWRVGVDLDKWYGNLYGVEVDIWADIGQIRSIQEACSDLTPQQQSLFVNTNVTNTQSAASNPTTLVTASDKHCSLYFWICFHYIYYNWRCHRCSISGKEKIRNVEAATAWPSEIQCARETNALAQAANAGESVAFVYCCFSYLFSLPWLS